MLAGLPALPARLCAVRPVDSGILALAGFVACLVALVDSMQSQLEIPFRGEAVDLPALQRLTAGQSAMDVLEPTSLILDVLFPTDAHLVNQERTLGTRDRIWMAVVLDARMPAEPWPGAVEPALRWTRAARLGRLKDGAPTGAANLIKDGFRAGVADTPMAQLLAVVLTAPQLPTTDAEADVFGFKVVIGRSGDVLSPLRCLSFCRPLLSGAADAPALVSTAVQLCPADSTAFGSLALRVMADGLCRCPAAPTRDIDLL